MKPVAALRPHLVVLAVLVATSALAQGTIYLAGDGSTSAVKGREVCATAPASMNAADSVSYSVAAASEFADFGPLLRGSVPNPMGRDTSATTAGRWGATVANPTSAPLTVTRVEIDCGSAGLFQAVNQVQPASGWTVTTNLVSWSGSLDVAANTSLDWIVQIQGRSQNQANIPITLRAFTAQGLLLRSGLVTTETNNNNNPYVSLPFVVGGEEVFSSGSAAAVAPGETATFIVRVKESEAGNNVAVPAGSALEIRVPAGFSSLTRLASSGFGAETVVQPSDCAPGTITAALSANLINSSRDFTFTAVAPAGLGSTGLFGLRARLTNGSAPIVDTTTDFTQAVTPPATAGTRDGLMAVATYVTVPDPMGQDRNSTWAVTFANPSDQPITIKSVQLYSPQGQDYFKAVTGIRPSAGWTRPTPSFIQWTGLVTVDPYQAADFVVSVQANSKDLSGPIHAVAIDTGDTPYLNTAGMTAENNGLPIASLYYLRLGQAAGYLADSVSGQPRQFQLTVDEKQNVNIPAGTQLRVVVPRGWSAVAASTQTGWSAPVVVQPGAGADGSVTATFSTALKNARRNFSFSATAPPGVRDSLYLFPTTLTGTPGINSLAQLVVQVVDVTGGLEVQNLSVPLANPAVNQIDLQVLATSSSTVTYRLEVFNFASGEWEELAAAAVGGTPVTVIGSITSRFPDYMDAQSRVLSRVVSSALGNHRLDLDWSFLIASYYRLLPSSVAPPTAAQGRTDLAMEKLRFEVDVNQVSVMTLRAQVLGSDVVQDVSQVHLYADADCDGAIDQPPSPLAPSQPITPGNPPLTFSDPGGWPILDFDTLNPRCAVVALDLTLAAGLDDFVAVQVTGGLDLTHSVGPYPFPCPAGYPVRSSDVIITVTDIDSDGLSDAEEAALGTDPWDADSDDDGLLDGQEVGSDGSYEAATDTDPLDADSDDDGLLDGLEDGVGPFSSVVDSDGDGTPDVADPDPSDARILGTDRLAFRPDLDPATRTDPIDDDSDDDGILDGIEDLDVNGRHDALIGGSAGPGSGETDPGDPDSDGDGLADGLEIGLAAPQGTDTDPALFRADADPATRTSAVDLDSDDDGILDGIEDRSRDGAGQSDETDAMDADSDEDGLADGAEAGADGVADPGETSALAADSDGDGLQDGTEIGLTSGVADPDGAAGPARGTDPAVFLPDLDPASLTSPLDDDSDDDGLLDGIEDLDHNGRADHAIGGSGGPGSGETDPRLADTDGDGCQDGTEIGLTMPQGSGTDPVVFRPDAVPQVTSDPLDLDSDDDGIADGAEDANCDGGIDAGETDPSGDPAVLRNDLVTSLAGLGTLKPAIFTGSGVNALVLAGPNRAPDVGEGPDPARNGSDDDDDLYARRLTPPWTDPDPLVADSARPLVFYQATAGVNSLRLVKAGGSVEIDWQ